MTDISQRNRQQGLAHPSFSPLQPLSPHHLTVISTGRRFSSDTSRSNTYSNNELVNILVNPHFESIRQLPEVDNALKNWDNDTALEDFRRAIQVFEMMETGGSFHIAVVTLLAECYQHQGKYTEVSRVLQTLAQIVSSDKARFLIDLANAKSLWYQGDFDRSMVQVEKALENNASHGSNLYRGCAMNAAGIVSLMKYPNETDEGCNSVVQLLKIAAKLTEKDSNKNASATLASASARGNLGVAMVVTRLGLNEVRSWQYDIFQLGNFEDHSYIFILPFSFFSVFPSLVR